MADTKDNTICPQTRSQGLVHTESQTAAIEPQCPLTNTGRTLPFHNRPRAREALLSESDVSTLDSKSSASFPSREHGLATSSQRRIGCTSQRLEVPPIQTRPRSISAGGYSARSFSNSLQPPPISSDESESENDVFSKGKSPIESTEATSSIGRASPLLATRDDESHHESSPVDLLLPVQYDQRIIDSHDFEEDDSILVETSADRHSPCDDRSLRIAQDSIQGVGITKGIYRRTAEESDLDVFSRSLGVEAASIVQGLHRGHLANAAIPIGRDEANSSSSDSEPDGQPAVKVTTLHCRIWDSMTMTPSGHRFLPRGCLDQLITEEFVEEELCRISMQEKKRKKLVERICIKEGVFDGKKCIQSIRQIFAILVLIDQSSEISLFIKEGISDYDLPLSTTEEEERKMDPMRRRDSSSRPSFEMLPRFQRWHGWQRENFWETQWKVIPPILEEGGYNDVRHVVLHAKDILPFVASKDSPIGNDVGNGGHGRVYEARIHQQHHDFRNLELCKRGLVIKEIGRIHKHSFDSEVKILQKFKGAKAHPHVASLLSTFEQGSKFSLVFYRAESDLRDFWRRENPTPTLNRENVIWVAKQCAGVASGLNRLHIHDTFDRSDENDEESKDISASEGKVKIAAAPQHITDRSQIVRGLTKDKLPSEKHNVIPPKREVGASGGNLRVQSELKPYQKLKRPAKPRKIRKIGRHGDIKPENILWYNDSTEELGTLCIIDFGVSELNSRMSKSKIRENVANTWIYRPPECDIPDRPIRESADMWSLGCVYLEFITWLLGGKQLLDEFSIKRSTYDEVHRQSMDTFFESDCKSRGASGKTIELWLKNAVTSFFDELHADPNCTEYLHEFLDLIRDRMLILEPPDSSETERIRSEELYQKLNGFYERCCNEEAYATEKRPWPIVSRKRLNLSRIHMKIHIPNEHSDKPSRRASPQNVMSALQKPVEHVYHQFQIDPQTH